MTNRLPSLQTILPPLWKTYLAAQVIEWLWVVSRMVFDPEGGNKAVLFTFSVTRVLLVLAATAITASLAYLFLRSILDRSWFEEFLHPTQGKWVERYLFPLGIALLWAGLFLTALPQIGDPDYRLINLYKLYQPISVGLVLTGLQTLAWWLVFFLVGNPIKGLGWKWLRSPYLALLTAAAVIFFLISVTRFGLDKDIGSWWFSPGVPLLEWQVLAGFLVGGLGLAIARHYSRSRFTRLVIFLPVLIWLAAVLIWTVTPWTPNSHFVPKPVLPNLEIYPFSDAAYYDVPAQTLLIGRGFNYGSVIVRPLFSLFLAGLHLIGGQDYNTLILLQTVVLAFFPVILYFLGRALHSRLAGVIAAVLCITREVNTILVSHTATVSSSKMIMSDLPAALALALLSLLFFDWLKRRQPGAGALVLGGTLGLAILLRYQLILLIPVIMVSALLAGGFHWRRWLGGSLLFLLGLGMVISPWLWRNFQNTGKIMLEEPQEVGFLAQLYSLDTSTRPQAMPGETEAEFNARVSRSILQFVVQHPDVVATFTIKNWINNEVSTLMVLPFWYGEVVPEEPYPYLSASFWLTWDRDLSPVNIMLILTNLVLAALGVASAWSHWRWAGLAPLVLHFGYSLSCAVARTSGFRFILPADWTGYFYFAIGVVFLLEVWFKLPHPAQDRGLQEQNSRRLWPVLGLSCILLVGISLPVVEKVVPPQFPDQSRETLIGDIKMVLVDSSAPLDVTRLSAFLEQPNAVIDRGRSLYPRYYESDKGIISGEKRFSAFLIRSFPRLGFILLGSLKNNVILPTAGVPKEFPNASEVIVIGCGLEDYVEARLVAVLDGPSTRIYTSDGDPLADCRQ